MGMERLLALAAAAGVHHTRAHMTTAAAGSEATIVVHHPMTSEMTMTSIDVQLHATIQIAAIVRIMDEVGVEVVVVVEVVILTVIDPHAIALPLPHLAMITIPLSLIHPIHHHPHPQHLPTIQRIDTPVIVAVIVIVIIAETALHVAIMIVIESEGWIGGEADHVSADTKDANAQQMQALSEHHRTIMPTMHQQSMA